jgi:hypothetical protein
MRQRKTDYGTIILHWVLVGAFGVAFVTGLRIATEAPDRTWINFFDAILPQNAWVLHMQAAVVLVMVAIAYTIYVVRSGLGSRIRLDKVRLRGLLGRGQARRGAANIVLYWVFFITMLSLMGSGGLLYFGFFAGYDMATLHWYGTWAILGFTGLHVLSHFGIGGASQLLRVFRPTGLSAPPPQLDAVELLTMLVEQSARLQPETERFETIAPEARLQPAQPESRMEPPQRGARLRPAPPEARVEPRQRALRLPPTQPEARMEPPQREVRLRPLQPEPRDEPLQREARPQPVQPETLIELLQRGVRPQPVQPEARMEPLQREVRLQPLQPEPRDEPLQREARPQPVQPEARIELSQREARPQPVQPEARMEPPQREVRLQPSQLEARDEAPQREARPRPVQPEPRDEPPQRDALLRPMLREAHMQPMLRAIDITRARPAARHPSSGTAARGRASKPRGPTFQSNPFVVAAAVAITGASLLLATDRLAVDQLRIHRITSAEAPVLDGDTSDRAWRNVQPFSVTTNQGGNFDGKGETKIDIRAVHDGTWAYFLFTWDDPTRSLKQLPLIKEVDGWHLMHDGYENGDEHEYNEDKFSVLLTTLDVTLAGDRTFHASPHPIPGAPATMTGRGLHYTMSEGVYADVWQWKATSGGPTGWMDDNHFGPPLDPTPMQVRNVVPYKGGFSPDPGTGNYTDNFVISDSAVGGARMITPRRLPANLAATTTAMGEIDIDPNHGENDGARWFMTEAESVPYSSDQDARIPVGTVIPGVIIAGDFSGDRADVRCAARWHSGHWALEVARRLDTHSRYDIPLQTGIFMRVAAFDHSQIRHTRHVRPIRLEVE